MQLDIFAGEDGKTLDLKTILEYRKLAHKASKLEIGQVYRVCGQDSKPVTMDIGTIRTKNCCRF